MKIKSLIDLKIVLTLINNSIGFSPKQKLVRRVFVFKKCLLDRIHHPFEFFSLIGMSSFFIIE